MCLLFWIGRLFYYDRKQICWIIIQQRKFYSLLTRFPRKQQKREKEEEEESNLAILNWTLDYQVQFKFQNSRVHGKRFRRSSRLKQNFRELFFVDQYCIKKKNYFKLFLNNYQNLIRNLQEFCASNSFAPYYIKSNWTFRVKSEATTRFKIDRLIYIGYFPFFYFPWITLVATKAYCVFLHRSVKL